MLPTFRFSHTRFENSAVNSTRFNARSQHNIYGLWYSTFLSPTGNLHWFTLNLQETLESSDIRLETKRIDERRSNPEFRLTAETSKPFVALLAKGIDDPGGMFSMMLKSLEPNQDALEVLDGQIIWNSLTDSTVKVGNLQFTRTPSSDHPAAKHKK